MGFMDDYEPVEDRIRAFYDDHPPPHGSVKTKLERDNDGEYIVKATLYIDGLSVSTGLAHDSMAQLPANMKASALEVCETSAIGRALANLGYAPKGKRPSREEMTKTAGGVAGPPATSPAPSVETGKDPVGGTLQQDNRGENRLLDDQLGRQPRNKLPSPVSTQRAVGAGGGAPGDDVEASAPAADCLHLHTTDDKPEGGKYKLGWAWCLDCRTPVKVKA